VFKTYDIRGVWGETIDIPLTYSIGRGCARLLKGTTFLVGHDARIHSKEMYDTFVKALTDQGRNCEGIGLCSTPQLHYLQHRHGFDAAAMITASHNPARYHGIKLFDSQGGSVSYGSGLEKLEEEVDRLGRTAPLIRPFDRQAPAAQALPSAALHSAALHSAALSEYIAFLSAAAEGLKFPQRVVIDASNGSAGKVFERLSESLGIDAILLNMQPDGRFPNHEPNPLEEASRTQTSKVVVDENADLGALLDGDGDRIIFFDNRGDVIENYFLSALLAEEVLRFHPESAIVYDLISSRVLPERISELGGRPVMSRVGYTFIHEKMVAAGAAFGTETSGHVYFKVSDNYYTESAAYALVVLLKFLSRKDKSLSELVDPLRSRYFQGPETNLSVTDKSRAIELVEERFRDGEIERIDGISVSYDDFWFNLRPSNTEPLLRLRLEATGAETAEARIAEIVELIAGV
jgi:phosphomannomutase